jgi:predicted amidohydrolase YtcJ
LIGTTTRVVDARGRLVLPGFNDAHVHFMGIGNAFSSIDLRSSRTSEDINGAIARYAEFLPEGRWILGGGWEAALPDRAAIDRLTSDTPVLIYRAGGRSAFVNGVAFRLAGFAPESVLDPDIRSTGIVAGETMRRIARAVPSDHIRNWPEIAETASRYAASLGVTSVQDMHSDDMTAVYRELDRQGKLKTRVYDCIPLPDWRKLDVSTSAVKGKMVRGGCLKSFADGDESSRTRLLRDVPAADRAGFQIMIHAIGNVGNGIVLDVFEHVIATNGARDRRLRVEHAHNPRVGDLPRFARSGILASMQPHLFGPGNGGYYGSLLRLKVPLAFGSDAAITDFNPLLGISSAVNTGAESISVYDAVRAYTLGSAYAEFQEHEKGSLEVGKLADIVVVSDDIFDLKGQGISNARVVLTIVGGKIVYEE